MKIAVCRERLAGELRVAATPDAVKKYVSLGAMVCIETGAGQGTAIDDAAYAAAGATLMNSAAVCVQDADIVLCVRPPEAETLQHLKPDALLIGTLDPYAAQSRLAAYNEKQLSAFALELLPRISRAQGMDVLSSQSNLAGYRAVIEAVAASGKVVPMMMTAAGTVPPAKVLVLGAGVAGLQAIATAKRLGAVVSAFDVRPAAKEQVESLGAKFIAVSAAESGEASGGYASEMSEDYKQKQQAVIHETITKQDMVIATALIPGKPAPLLITEAMVKDMKKGAIIVDLAVGSGGNCPLSETDKVVEKHGITLIGYGNLPSRAAVDASPLYARNLYNFVSALLVGKDGALDVKWDDELVKGTLLTKDGMTVQERFR